MLKGFKLSLHNIFITSPAPLGAQLLWREEPIKTPPCDARGQKCFLKFPKTSISCPITIGQPLGYTRDPWRHVGTTWPQQNTWGQHLTTIQCHYTEVHKMVCKTKLRRTQARPSRGVKQQQEKTSPNLERTIKWKSVVVKTGAVTVGNR